MRLATFLIVCVWALTDSTIALAQAQPTLDPYLAFINENLRVRPDGVRIPSSVAANEAIISIPVEHLQTGVLRRDLRLRGGALANFLNAGAPGYYAGTFNMEGQSPHAMWCFATRPDDVTPEIRCLIEYGFDRAGQPVWVVAREPSNKYLPIGAQVSRNPSTMPAPEIEERSVMVHPDLRAEYIFRSWTPTSADVQLRLGGDPILAIGAFRRISRQPDGAVLLMTPSGAIRLTQAGSNRRRANVELLQPAASSNQ
jgi:hypothetical protein